MKKFKLNEFLAIPGGYDGVRYECSCGSSAFATVVRCKSTYMVDLHKQQVPAWSADMYARLVCDGCASLYELPTAVWNVI